MRACVRACVCVFVCVRVRTYVRAGVCVCARARMISVRAPMISVTIRLGLYVHISIPQRISAGNNRGNPFSIFRENNFRHIVARLSGFNLDNFGTYAQ